MAFGRRRVAAAFCVLPLLLTGCAADPEPRLAPPSETPTTESPSPSATPTREPWEKKTDAGAVAFAKHWIDTFSEAMNSGDTSDLQALSARSCETCAGVIERLNTIYGSGGTYRSDGWRVLEADAVVDDVRATVAMNVHRSAEVFTNDADGAEQRNPASQGSYSAVLAWSDGGWIMSRLDLAG